MTTRIKITTGGPPTPVRRNSLLDSLYEARVTLLRLFDSPDGYVALCKDEASAEKLFSAAVTRLLASKGFTPQMPLETKARLTLVLMNLDRYVMDRSSEEVLEDLKDQANATAESVFILRGKYMMKIQFGSHETAKKIKENGVYLFRLFVSPEQIEFERYSPVVQCFTCYKYGHIKTQCPDKDKNLKLCSECGSNNHTSR